MEKLDEDDRLSLYINSLVNVFDPHTEYFPPRDKENFDIRFSGQLEGIGAQLTQKNEYVEVSRIIPGSPSWKQGELEVGDYIIKVAQEGEEPVDIVDMRLDDAVQLIRGKKGSTVILTVKKLDRTINEITLVRDVVVLEETYAKSAIITDEETGKKYGYIKLPSFYVDFAQINGKNCFDDMKLEIEKLKKENINGIVFDLRDNGGGSLEDVVKIAGLFIEKGPIVQSSGQKGDHKTYKDTDPAIQYDGPLVVMVNAISASASEIFAAAMQDYNRAVIIGGNSSYGKGTVQNFTELDRMVPKKPADMKELGSLKITVQKFYRINGGATQLKGVVPDIIFPDYYNYMEFSEKYLDNAMPWDEISPVAWNAWTPTYDPEFIASVSEKRIETDTTFILIEENGKRLQEIRDNTVYSLNYDDHKDLITLRENEGKRYKNIGKDTLNLVVNPTQTDMSEIIADTSKQARTDVWLMGLRKDVYLFEAYHILQDITDYNAKNARKAEDK
jgi:carboxyl-terminal processing protease